MKSYDLPEIDYQIAAEPDEAAQINRELNLARCIVEQTCANLFLTGKAGTGKTTFLRNLQQTSRKRMVVLAPTGVAAINAKGMTIHSFFQLPLTPFVPGRGFVGDEKREYRFSKQKRRLIGSLDLLVIDEVSMVRPDMLDAVDSVLRRYRNPSRPFGGVQLLLIGDLRQLAPVVTHRDEEYVRPYYKSPYFFESTALKSAGFLTVELLTIYRQSDTRFISLLNAVRDGRADYSTLQALNSRCTATDAGPEWENAIRLTTHNTIADRINQSRMSALQTSPVTYRAEIKGKFPESAYPADEFLTLKPGARVMFTRNDNSSERAFFNGLLGTVIALGGNSVTVRPDDGGADIVAVSMEWENARYELNETTKEIQQVIDGTFSQIPLRQAWAITIHKSQGLTFDRAIIDASRAFAPGQLYVALSRCRTLEGMLLDSPLPASAVIIDKDVDEFINDERNRTPDANTVDTLRDEYYRSALADLFDFSGTRMRFLEYSRVVQDYVAPISPHLYAEFSEAEKALADEIEAVGNRFITLYANSALRADTAESNEALTLKIKNGCRYFAERLKKLTDLARDTPLNAVDNKAYRTRLLNSAEAFMFDAVVKQKVLDHLSGRDFTPGEMLNAKTRAALEFDGITVSDDATTKASKKRKGVTSRPIAEKAEGKKEAKTKTPKGYSARESLKLFRNGMTVERIATERQLSPSTIAGHLAQFVNTGELTSQQLFGEELQGFLDRLLQKHPDLSITQLREYAGDRMQPWQISAFYHIVKGSH